MQNSLRNRFRPQPRSERRYVVRLRSGLLAMLLLVLVGGAALVVTGDTLRSPAEPTNHEAWLPANNAPAPDPVLPATSTPVPTPTVSSTPEPPLYQLPGPVPASGKGSFDYARTGGAVLGRAGRLLRYRVAVEHGSGENLAEFTEAVDRALGDPGSWIGSGQLRLQRVPDGAKYDFTVYLATAGTAGRMCLAGSVDIRVNGKPYTSCRAPGKAILNLDRWRRSVPHFVDAGIPLDVYRLYVVNHEVGHELGHRHERCPGTGRTAPVMMQQTLFLKGCAANPWPYVKGKRYAGPPL
ncbi:hypothetical protein GCM10027290_59440 [Micromonospora sonneratiae]|uniref:DUF3152 domain-containing protein n=1 Tax=Micromonospora sonneratiae TaxID=1184706 RepID=A0ABW3Y6E8_9ACTN